MWFWSKLIQPLRCWKTYSGNKEIINHVPLNSHNFGQDLRKGVQICYIISKSYCLAVQLIVNRNFIIQLFSAGFVVHFCSPFPPFIICCHKTDICQSVPHKGNLHWPCHCLNRNPFIYKGDDRRFKEIIILSTLYIS